MEKTITNQQSIILPIWAYDEMMNDPKNNFSQYNVVTKTHAFPKSRRQSFEVEVTYGDELVMKGSFYGKGVWLTYNPQFITCFNK